MTTRPRAAADAAGNDTARAVETVAWMGTPAAKKLLADWAAGAAAARFTAAARR